MIARLLYKDSPIVVLDEPTAALDPIAESDIYQKYNELTEGKSAIFISHRLASTRFCDRILFLETGESHSRAATRSSLKKAEPTPGFFRYRVSTIPVRKRRRRYEKTANIVSGLKKTWSAMPGP